MENNPHSDETRLLPSQYRKKPVVIEAFQFTQELAEAHLLDKVPVPFGLGMAGSYHEKDRVVHRATITISTLEGIMRADIGDWVIKGVKGELYPCKPDIFAATYDTVHAIPTPPAQPSGLPQTETVKTLGEHALELCWKIEELPASELQTQISIIASELRTRIYTTLGQMGAKVVTSPSQMGAAQPSGLSLEEREAIEKFLYETERTETLHRTHATLGMSPKDRHDVAAAPAIRKLMERVDDYDELQRLADASNAESCDLQEKLTKEVRDHENTVGERDQAEEAISQAYYLVKFADKRFAERGIELTALQHDIAKANRQLTAAQADLLNVREERDAFQLGVVELTRQILTNGERVKVLEDALRKLACLGNGDRFGNSDGNLIARAALTPPKEGGAE